MKTFEECCEYLGISTELPKCQIDQRKIQAAYKLRVCMSAWNKLDGFEPNETAFFNLEYVGYTPHLNFKNGRVVSSGYALAYHSGANSIAYIGLRLRFFSRKRAIEFGETFINIFNELI